MPPHRPAKRPAISESSHSDASGSEAGSEEFVVPAPKKPTPKKKPTSKKPSSSTKPPSSSPAKKTLPKAAFARPPPKSSPTLPSSLPRTPVKPKPKQPDSDDDFPDFTSTPSKLKLGRGEEKFLNEPLKPPTPRGVKPKPVASGKGKGKGKGKERETEETEKDIIPDSEGSNLSSAPPTPKKRSLPKDIPGTPTKRAKHNPPSSSRSTSLLPPSEPVPSSSNLQPPSSAPAPSNPQTATQTSHLAESDSESSSSSEEEPEEELMTLEMVFSQTRKVRTPTPPPPAVEENESDSDSDDSTGHPLESETADPSIPPGTRVLVRDGTAGFFWPAVVGKFVAPRLDRNGRRVPGRYEVDVVGDKRRQVKRRKDILGEGQKEVGRCKIGQLKEFSIKPPEAPSDALTRSSTPPPPSLPFSGLTHRDQILTLRPHLSLILHESPTLSAYSHAKLASFYKQSEKGAGEGGCNGDIGEGLIVSIFVPELKRWALRGEWGMQGVGGERERGSARYEGLDAPGRERICIRSSSFDTLPPSELLSTASTYPDFPSSWFPTAPHIDQVDWVARRELEALEERFNNEGAKTWRYMREVRARWRRTLKLPVEEGEEGKGKGREEEEWNEKGQRKRKVKGLVNMAE